jgi:hypothetical protein
MDTIGRVVGACWALSGSVLFGRKEDRYIENQTRRPFFKSLLAVMLLCTHHLWRTCTADWLDTI